MMPLDKRFFPQFATLTAMVAVTLAVFFTVPAMAGEGKLVAVAEPMLAPEIMYQGEDGKEHALSELKGKTVLLHFWATWCVPCREELPKLVAAVAPLENENFVMVPISLDRKIEAARAYLDMNKVVMPVWLDPKSAAMRAFELRGLPSTVLIDAEGKQVARGDGVVNWEDTEVIETIKKASAP